MRPVLSEHGGPVSERKTVIRIIDDSCALALEVHPQEGESAPASPIYWDQSEAEDLGAKASEFWNVPADLGYGREVSRATIDTCWFSERKACSDRATSADRVYETLRVNPGTQFGRERNSARAEIASHGTNVMDIAACGPRRTGVIPSDADGNRDHEIGGGSLPDINIIFVQLPGNAVRSGSASVLAYHHLPWESLCLFPRRGDGCTHGRQRQLCLEAMRVPPRWNQRFRALCR